MENCEKDCKFGPDPFNESSIITQSNPIWIGEIKNYEIAKWIDSMIMLIFGGLPWQAYFQRVLSAMDYKSLIEKLILESSPRNTKKAREPKSHKKLQSKI